MNDYLINIIMKVVKLVYLCFNSTRPDADVIKGNVRDQLGLRVSLGNLSNDGYRMTFGQTDKNFKRFMIVISAEVIFSILGQYNEPILFDAPLMEQYDFVEDVKQILNKE